MSIKGFYQPTTDDSINNSGVVIRKSYDRAQAILDFCEAYYGKSLKDKTLLDLGCNTGYFTNFFSSRCAHAEGMEIMDKNVELAKSFYPEVAKNIKNGDIFIDLYLYEKYDIILFLNVLHTMLLTKPEEIVQEALKVIDEKTKDLLFLEMRENGEMYWLPQELDDVVEQPKPILDPVISWDKEKIKSFVLENTSFNQCQEIMVSDDIYNSSRLRTFGVPNIPINRTLLVFYRISQ
jgi:SAM-dependent methyltransferase